MAAVSHNQSFAARAQSEKERSVTMDEVEALSKTIEMGRPRWLPTSSWHLEDNEWHVTFDSEVTFRFRQSDGQLLTMPMVWMR
ncbi:hypothetical protein [Neorhizobium sp. SHOUNA12B]|uniref:hypothetical protein n=1 Tax=Neorhizobium sp. SHOUNA12B TaxID=2908928 RepID=UPI0025CF3202|nr:hypothetical protein [Neorhizobium sp. SHOUNA12B]MCJ9671437.1 hypothetical protein [Neorhizobium sp. SHOUNA12B]